MAQESYLHQPFIPTPIAILSYFSGQGQPLACITNWVGIICGRPAQVRVGWNLESACQENPWAGGDFVVNLPSDDLLQMPEFRFGWNSTGKPLLEHFQLQTSSAVSVAAPLITDCPVRIECRSGQVNYDFLELEGEVVAYHREEVTFLELDNVDLCVLRPLSLQPFPE